MYRFLKIEQVNLVSMFVRRGKMSEKKARIEFIDIAKGIAIFLVVWGHTATNEELLGDPAMMYKIFYSIHMPLFFFLSGLSITAEPLKTWDEWHFFFKKLLLTVAFPYFAWALIYCTFNFTNVRWILYGSWAALGKAASATCLWYMSCLFVARILAQALINIIGEKPEKERNIILSTVAVVAIAIGVILPSIEIGYPWNFNVALVATGCILFGIVLKKTLIELSYQKISLLFALLIASIAIYAVTIYLRGDVQIMMMCKGVYGNGIGVVINTITGGAAVIFLAMLMKRFSEGYAQSSIRPMRYIGQYTLGILLLHKPFMQQVLIPGLTDLWGDAIGQGWVRFISTVIVIILSLVVCQIISYFVPELMGIFSKDKIQGSPFRKVEKTDM